MSQENSAESMTYKGEGEKSALCNRCEQQLMSYTLSHLTVLPKIPRHPRRTDNYVESMSMPHLFLVK